MLNSDLKATSQKTTILVVDDTPANLRLLKVLLTKKAYQLIAATSGEQALILAKTKLPDLILLDIMMPGMNGFEVCKRLKASNNPQVKEIPIIFISALNQTLDKVKAFSTGGVDYITKPFQADEVLARVETHLTLRHLQRTLQERNAQLEQEIIEHQMAEEKLRKFSRAVEQSANIIVISDLTGKVEYVNPAFCQATGYSQEEVIGSTANVFLSGDLPKEVHQQLWSTLERSEVWQGELLNKRKDGETYWEFATISPIRNSDGKTTHYLAVKENIMARKRMEEQLQSNLQFLRVLMDAIPIPLFYKDSRNHYLGCNVAFSNFVGKTLAELKKSPDFLSETISQDESLAHMGKQAYEMQVQHKDGSQREVIFNQTVFFEANGKVGGTISTFTDITDIKHAKDALRKKNQDLEDTIRKLEMTQEELVQAEKMAILGQLATGITHELNTPLGAIRSSIENIASFLSQRLTQLPTFFESLSERENVQQSFLKLLSTIIEPRAQLSSKEKRVLRKKLTAQLQPYAIENTIIIADMLVEMGVHDEVETFIPIIDKTLTDNDVFKLAYELASLQMSTHNIESAVERATKSVLALKSFAQREKNTEKIKVNVTEGIDTVLTLYHNQFKQGIQVVKQYSDTPGVPCYPDELNQVWINLINNAVQAMKHKGVLTIKVGCREDDVIVSISDTGHGIPKDMEHHIFEPFFSSTKGIGLGLDTAKKIIDKHHGHIYLDNQIDVGSTFQVFLPVH